MNNLPKIYFNIQSRLFPIVEEEIGEITEKLQEFLRKSRIGRVKIVLAREI